MSDSREFEKLIARIEAQLLARGATIKSPDHIADKLTGQSREVDAAIRSRVGSAEILVTIECRDRVRTEDVTWIEQLATKRQHIGAAHTIAVSSTGFSEPAIAAARHHGISIRVISEIVDEEFAQWASELDVYVSETACEFGPVTLSFLGTWTPAPTLVPSSQDVWNTLGWTAAIFCDQATGSRLSLTDLVVSAIKQRVKSIPQGASVDITLAPLGTAWFSSDPLAALMADVPHHSTPVERVYNLVFMTELISAETNFGILALANITFRLKLTCNRTGVPLARLLSYSSDSAQVARVAERDVTLSPTGHKLILTEARASASVMVDGRDEASIA